MLSQAGISYHCVHPTCESARISIITARLHSVSYFSLVSLQKPEGNGQMPWRP